VGLCTHAGRLHGWVRAGVQAVQVSAIGHARPGRGNSHGGSGGGSDLEMLKEGQTQTHIRGFPCASDVRAERLPSLQKPSGSVAGMLFQ
jgi:hypothetical protein